MFLFSALFSFFILPIIIFWVHPDILSLSLINILLLLIVGVLNALAVYFYLKALNLEESSIIVPLLQLVPIFGYALGYPILGEVLTKQELIASALILIGVIIISIDIDIDNNRVSIKKKILLLVALSSFLFALHDILFKLVAVQSTFAISAFWQYAGLFAVGVFVYIFSPTYRNQFLNLFRVNSKVFMGLNVFNEIIYLLGNLANNFATLLVPVALVLVVSSYQPLFVFIGGTLLTVFLPNIVTEKISIKHLIQKILAIVIIIIGSYMLYSTVGF